MTFYTPRVIDPHLAVADHACAIRTLVQQDRAPGFIMGLSGTDSILTFLICAKALEKMGLEDRLIGIHYRDEKTPEQFERARALKSDYGWFADEVLPWLQERAPDAQIMTASALGGNRDPQIWADLSLRSLCSISHDSVGKPKILDLPKGENYWVVSSRNATEEALGTYSQGSKTATVFPITDLWKSEVMQICAYLEVSTRVMAAARVPDCVCARAETAAQNIEAIDHVLMNRKRFLEMSYLEKTYSPELLKIISSYIDDQKKIARYKKKPHRARTVSVRASYAKLKL